MNSFQNIPIVEGGADGGITPAIQALLNELSERIQQLMLEDQPASIDLHALLGEMECQTLRNLLGKGEISATLSALGDSLIEETEVSGVWWIEHRNSTGDVISEFIEVTRCPAILMTPEEDLPVARDRLQELIAGTAGGSGV